MQVSGHTQQVLHNVLWSALDTDEGLYTAGVVKVLGSELDGGEWLYTAGIAKVLGSELYVGE
jgi:hypothetical protein